MKYFLFLILLPCLWADVVPKIPCPDGTTCPFGKFCCKLPTSDSGCCDLTKSEQEDKRLKPAISPFITVNVSLTPAKDQRSYCYGTQCGDYCAVGRMNAVCCSNPMYSCPSGTRCCTTSYTADPWCCTSRQRCYSSYGYCIDGAASTSVAIVSVLFAFILGVTSKHFL